MLERLLTTVALAVLCAFLGILIWKVPSPDLIVVVAVTALLAAFDFFRPRRTNRR
jgi:hypothetical protein